MSDNETVKILLVDDQPARLLSYEVILKDLGHELVQVRSGFEALQRLIHGDFAVILLDVNMPVMDGFETAELIHQHPRHENTPIVFVTALHISDLDRLKGYELGAVDYVFIPVIPQILRSKVSALVELYCKKRELERLNERLKLANADLAESNSALQVEKARDLGRLNEDLAKANADLARANTTLTAEIEERNKLEQALKEADRRKDEFIAMLAHELRNPLAPIHNGLQLMRLSPVRDPETLACREMIERQVEQLTRLVDDLMDVSRITQGKLKLQKEPVELASVVAGAVETCRPLLDARRHVLTIDLPERPVRLEADSTRLAQVIGNLLNNAAKYTDEGGRISVSAQVVDDGGRGLVRVSVKDSGVGMPPEVLPRLFALFSQGDRTIERAEGGLGVGLALVQRLVQMHGGRVSAHSEGVGKGSEFVVELPLASGDLDSLEAVRRADSEGPPIATARRVLVVDDNVDSATSLAMLLRMTGNEVQVAHDGLECLERAATFLPEFVLLDIGMPRLNGYDTAKRIRQQPWGKDMVLIALTGWGQEEVRTRIQEAGFDVHLIKPVDAAVLTKILAERASDSRKVLSSMP